MNKGFENLKKDIPLPRISQKRLNKLIFFRKNGGVAERLIASVLKTDVLERVPGVRIPAPPPFFSIKN
jgi:hypothetical protein